MAENIRLSRLILNDSWPGTPNPNLGIPAGGFDATAWNYNTTDATLLARTPPYPPGTKIQAYTDNSECPGYYTMIYLARHAFSDTDCISSDFSEAVIFCAPIGESCATHAGIVTSDASMGPPWYVVAQCYSLGASHITCASLGAPLAVACTTTDADSSILDGTDPAGMGHGHSYQWFWCGGVCPCADITLLRGLGDSALGADITVDSVQRGPVYACYSAGTTGGFMLTSDVTAVVDTTEMQDNIMQSIGWACVSSAT